MRKSAQWKKSPNILVLAPIQSINVYTVMASKFAIGGIIKLDYLKFCLLKT